MDSLSDGPGWNGSDFEKRIVSSKVGSDWDVSASKNNCQPPVGSKWNVSASKHECQPPDWNMSASRDNCQPHVSLQIETCQPQKMIVSPQVETCQSQKIIVSLMSASKQGCQPPQMSQTGMVSLTEWLSASQQVQIEAVILIKIVSLKLVQIEYISFRKCQPPVGPRLEGVSLRLELSASSWSRLKCISLNLNQC